MKKGLGRAMIIFRLFGRVLWELWWWQLLRRLRGAEVAERRKPQLLRRQAVRIRETALFLGGVLIKLGQFFSTRVDLLPREYTEELSRLQDEVTPVAVEAVCQVIEEELGRPPSEVFSWFDSNYLAAASLGQVHLAMLPSGEKVAVKVLRPGIEGVIAEDLKTLERVIILLELLTDWGKRFDLWAVYREFSRVLLAEMDYLQEGQNAERFKNNFSSDPGVKVPSIFWDYTTRRVLTMEYVEGHKIVQVAEWADLVPPGEVVKKLIEVYIRQVLEHGFFHADPHPGNILVLPDGRLGFVDFGMVGIITAHDREALRELVLAVGSKNAPGIVKAFLELGFLRPESDLVVIRRALEQLLERFADRHIGEFTNEQWLEIARDFEEIVRGEAFQIPSNYIFIGRTVGTIFGLCVALEPEARFIALLEPHLKRLIIQESEEGEAPDYFRKAFAFGHTLLEIPGRIQRTLTLAEQGNLHIKVDSSTLSRRLQAQEKALRFVGRTVIFAAFLLTSTLLYVHDFRFEAHVNLALAIVTAIIILLGLGEKSPS